MMPSFLPVAPQLKVGLGVKCWSSANNDEFYNATVVEVTGEGTVKVDWEDTEEVESEEVPLAYVRASKEAREAAKEAKAAAKAAARAEKAAARAARAREKAAKLERARRARAAGPQRLDYDYAKEAFLEGDVVEVKVGGRRANHTRLTAPSHTPPSPHPHPC